MPVVSQNCSFCRRSSLETRNRYFLQHTQLGFVHSRPRCWCTNPRPSSASNLAGTTNSPLRWSSTNWLPLILHQQWIVLPRHRNHRLALLPEESWSSLPRCWLSCTGSEPAYLSEASFSLERRRACPQSSFRWRCLGRRLLPGSQRRSRGIYNK